MISIWGITKLKVENSFINYFKEKTEIYKGMKIIDRELGGTTPLDIIVKFNENENNGISINSSEDQDDLSSLFVQDKSSIENWLTPDKLEHAKSDALIMHPGPMNRGIEIDTILADDINKSVIKEQVELGVAVRMACLKIFCT